MSNTKGLRAFHNARLKKQQRKAYDVAEARNRALLEFLPTVLVCVLISNGKRQEVECPGGVGLNFKHAGQPAAVTRRAWK